MISARMLYIMPMIIWSGISVDIYTNVMMTLMIRAMRNSQDTHPHLARDTD